MLVAIRALGLINKTITGPFWRLIETKKNQIELSPATQELSEKFGLYSKDATDLLNGVCAFSEGTMHQDDEYQSLVYPKEDKEGLLRHESCL